MSDMRNEDAIPSRNDSPPPKANIMITTWNDQK